MIDTAIFELPIDEAKKQLNPQRPITEKIIDDKPPKKKRVVSEETKERLRNQLKKARAVSAENRKKRAADKINQQPKPKPRQKIKEEVEVELLDNHPQTETESTHEEVGGSAKEVSRDEFYNHFKTQLDYLVDYRKNALSTREDEMENRRIKRAETKRVYAKKQKEIAVVNERSEEPKQIAVADVPYVYSTRKKNNFKWM